MKASQHSVEYISRVVSDVVSRYDVREVYLFGSCARGDARPDSDVDLRLLCGDTMTFGMLDEIASQLQGRMGCSVDLVTNPPEYMKESFRQRIQGEEVLLYEAV